MPYYLAPPTLTRAEQDALLRASSAHPRDHLILSVALGTGLRLAEIVGLNVGDVFLPDGPPRGRIRLRREIAKGGRVGDVFLPDALLPKLEKQEAHLEKERSDLQAESDGLLKQLATMTGTDGKTLVAEKLDALARRRQELGEGIAEVATAAEGIRRQAVDETVVREALAHIGEVYEALPPYRRKDLIRLVLDSAQVSETELRLGIRGRLPSLEVLKRGPQSGELAKDSETSKWLLGLMSQSPVVFDLAMVRAVRGLWATLRMRLAA